MATTEKNLRLWQRLLLVFLWAWLLVFFLWWYLSLARPTGMMQDIAFKICIEAGRPWVGYLGDSADRLGVLRSGWMLLVLPLGTALNTTLASLALLATRTLLARLRPPAPGALAWMLSLALPLTFLTPAVQAAPLSDPDFADISQSCDAGSQKDCEAFVAALEQGCSGDGDYAIACYILGTLYQKGNHTLAPQPKKALQPLLRACEGRHTEACIAAGWLAQSYEIGSPDLPLAHKMFKIACEELDKLACYLLGELYRLGRGVERDRIESFKWLLIASNLGSEKARDSIDKLALKPEEFQEARKRLRAWCKDNGC